MYAFSCLAVTTSVTYFHIVLQSGQDSVSGTYSEMGRGLEVSRKEYVQVINILPKLQLPKLVGQATRGISLKPSSNGIKVAWEGDVVWLQEQAGTILCSTGWGTSQLHTELEGARQEGLCDNVGVIRHCLKLSVGARRQSTRPHCNTASS